MIRGDRTQDWATLTRPTQPFNAAESVKIGLGQ
jgi:hypothetical protein